MWLWDGGENDISIIISWRPMIKTAVSSISVRMNAVGCSEIMRWLRLLIYIIIHVVFVGWAAEEKLVFLNWWVRVDSPWDVISAVNFIRFLSIIRNIPYLSLYWLIGADRKTIMCGFPLSCRYFLLFPSGFSALQL